MNILVSGGAGYLGSVLLPKLLVRGHRVRVVDIGYFGVSHLKLLRPSVEIVREDIRRILAHPRFGRKLLDGCDCVLHLAAISNDPSADLNPKTTSEVNFRATCALAELCREKRARFIFSSTCSVYGHSEGEIDEAGTLHPLTTYAASKLKAEKALCELSHPRWKPIILRNGTLFGYSPRMRFDLVVNTFALYSTLYNRVQLFGDGKQWRPFLHVRDCAEAFVHFCENREIHGGTYNVAHENLRVTDVAKIFQRLNPRLRIIRSQTTAQDKRDYRIRTERMREAGFRTRIAVETGSQEMAEAIASGLIPDPESIFYQNSKWIKELTQVSPKNNRDLLELLETLRRIQPTGSLPKT